MRATEILPEREALFEMPYLTAGRVDWGLDDPRRNRRRATAILHSNPMTVRQDKYGSLYRIANPGGGGEFARIGTAGQIVYYMQYRTAQRQGFGQCATQVKVWMTIAVGTAGLAADVFFHIMLAEFDTMISDHIQTEDGKRFWLRRMSEAIPKQMQVGLFDHGTAIFYDPQVDFDQWVAKTDAWGTRPEHHERIFFISKTAQPTAGNLNARIGIET
jgi:hypothetical protein